MHESQSVAIEKDIPVELAALALTAKNGRGVIRYPEADR